MLTEEEHEKLRKMDAEIHEKIFGEKVLGWEGAWAPDGPPFTIHRGAPRKHPIIVEKCLCGSEYGDEERDCFGHKFSCLTVVPFYTTDMNHANQVAKKIGATVCFNEEKILAYVDFYKMKSGWHHYTDESPALAICYLALKLES